MEPNEQLIFIGIVWYQMGLLFHYVQFAPYEIKKTLNLDALSDRRVNARRLFIFDMLTGKTESSYLFI